MYDTCEFKAVTNHTLRKYFNTKQQDGNAERENLLGSDEIDQECSLSQDNFLQMRIK